MLGPIGIEADEELAYLTLVRSPRALATAELAAEVGWTPNAAEAVARTLQARGLVLESDPPVRWSAVAPDVALEGLAWQRIEQARAVQRQIPDLMRQFWESPRDAAGADFIEVRHGSPAELRRMAVELLSRATTRVRAFERHPFPWQPFATEQRVDREVQAAMLEEAAAQLEPPASAVRRQVVYDRSQVDDEVRWRLDIAPSLRHGEESRVADRLPLKMVLLDDWGAQLPLLDRTGRLAGSAVVHSSPLLEGLSALFDSYWERAVPLGLGPAAEVEAGTLEEALVPLLAAGHTDATIANLLQVSRSTVQRVVSALMERQGVRTRFQLGVQLGRRGREVLEPASGA